MSSRPTDETLSDPVLDTGSPSCGLPRAGNAQLHPNGDPSELRNNSGPVHALTPLRAQVLAGILPISRVSAAPLCVYYAAQLLPLETIYGLQHPSLSSEPAADRRTWREPRSGQSSAAKAVHWTAMDILTAFALKKGWLTAKAGRPDVSRAGNASEHTACCFVVLRETLNL